MILYKNPATAKIAANYNAVYAADTGHFRHRVTFEAIDSFMASHGLDPKSCIDIGCGQGQVLMHIADALTKRGATLDGRQLVGVDISEVAIDQCESKRSDLGWIVDRYQTFLNNDAFRSLFPNGVDLIVNKGGFTHVRSEKEYRRTTERTRDALSENGFYLFIKNVKFYKKWSHTRAKKWEHDPLQIIFDCFGEPFTFPNSGYFVYLFAKDSRRQPQDTFPHHVDFALADGSNFMGLVHFDPRTRARVLSSVRPEIPSRKLLITDIYLSPAPEVRVAMTAVLNRDKCLPADTLVVKSQWRTSKAFVERAHELCSVSADHIMFGGSFTDWLVDPEFRQSHVDADEFENRLNWFLGFIRRHQASARLHFVTVFPISQGPDTLGNIYSPETAEPFRRVVQTLTKRYGVELMDLTDGIAQRAGAARFFFSEKARAATIQLGTQAAANLRA